MGVLAWHIVGCADINKDGNVDIVWRNASTGENYVWYMSVIAHIGGEYLPFLGEQDWKIATAVEY
jgi:hypothetical protein